VSNKTKWIIEDWAGNLIQFKGRPTHYESFDDAEEVLCEELDDNYETDRGEYYIIETDYL
jgi:hypothetical protein